jgi:hypothetical protein
MATSPEPELLLSIEDLRDDLERRLDQRVVTLDVKPGVDPKRTPWSAILDDGSQIEGEVVLTLCDLDGSPALWPQIVLGYERTAAGEPSQLLRDRLEAVAAALERLVNDVRVRPQTPAHDLAGRLREIRELAVVE